MKTLTIAALVAALLASSPAFAFQTFKSVDDCVDAGRSASYCAAIFNLKSGVTTAGTAEGYDDDR